METVLAEIGKVAGIFGLSWFSFWPALPAGLALGLNPIVVIATVTISYISGVLIVLLPGKRIRDWVQKRFGRQMDAQTENEDSFVRRMWERYGVIGFGLTSPMTVGAQLGALVGIAFNIPRRRLLLWMSLGALGWAIVLTLLALVGIESLDHIF